MKYTCSASLAHVCNHSYIMVVNCRNITKNLCSVLYDTVINIFAFSRVWAANTDTGKKCSLSLSLKELYFFRTWANDHISFVKHGIIYLFSRYRICCCRNLPILANRCLLLLDYTLSALNIPNILSSLSLHVRPAICLY